MTRARLWLSRLSVPVVARNVVCNWAGMALSMLAGVILAPFLIHRLGEETYGLWILIGSLTGYFGLLDLGVRGSVGRYIAFHRAQDDRNAVNGVLNTALAVLLVVAAIVSLATLGAVWAFPHLFDVPADQLAGARVALLLVGVTIGLTFPIAVFDSVLWAMQRFDLLNLVDIPTTLVRLAATFYLITGDGNDLVTLAVITIVTTALSAIAKAVISFRIDRSLRLGARHVTMGAFRKIYGYGIWSFLLAMAREGRSQLSPLLVGGLLSVQVVTLYSIGSRLIGYASQFVIAATGVLTPYATTLHARDNRAEQQRLFVEGGKYCAAVALFFLVAFFSLGKAFVTLWVGAELAAASAVLLYILAVGEVLPMSQWVTYSMILGMARHKLSAWVAVLEAILMVVLMVVLARPWGLVGVCIGAAVSGTICRGIFQAIYGCRLMGLPLVTYCHRAMLRPLVIALVAGVAMKLLTDWRPPTTWVSLIGYGFGLSAFYVAAAFAFLGGYEELRSRRRPAAGAEAPAADDAPAAAAVGGAAAVPGDVVGV